MQLLRTVKRFPIEKAQGLPEKDIHMVFSVFKQIPHNFYRLQNGEGMKLWHKP